MKHSNDKLMFNLNNLRDNHMDLIVCWVDFSLQSSSSPDEAQIHVETSGSMSQQCFTLNHHFSL